MGCFSSCSCERLIKSSDGWAHPRGRQRRNANQVWQRGGQCWKVGRGAGSGTRGGSQVAGGRHKRKGLRKTEAQREARMGEWQWRIGTGGREERACDRKTGRLVQEVAACRYFAPLRVGCLLPEAARRGDAAEGEAGGGWRSAVGVCAAPAQPASRGSRRPRHLPATATTLVRGGCCFMLHMSPCISSLRAAM